MRAFTKKSVFEKAKIETEKYVNENLEEISYNVIYDYAPSIVKQVEAMMLYAMHLHGYREKRIHDIHKWFCETANLPSNILGKTTKSGDVISFVSKTYSIDFDEVKCNFQTYEQYKKSNGKA